MSAMVKCDGCGFNVEHEDVTTLAEQTLPGHCDTCTRCHGIPYVREAYRRGFNDGVNKMAEAVVGVIEKKNELRKQ